MWAFFLLWSSILIVSTLLIVTRCTSLIYLIFCTPIFITFIYFLVKNDTVQSADNAEKFLKNFKMGGHRGAPLKAPENTLESLMAAKRDGCQLVEFDIHMTKDGVPVLMHDESTGRTAEKDFEVDQVEWKVLEELRLKSVNNTNAKIVRLNETIDFCLKYNLKMIFDMKNDNQKLVEQVANEIINRRIYDRVLVSSFNVMVPWRLKKIDARIVTGLTLDRSYYSFKDDFRKNPFTTNFIGHWRNEVYDELNLIASPLYILPRFLGVDVLVMSYRLISEDAIREAREKNFAVIAWTVNDPDYVKIMRKLEIPFLTDVPDEVNTDNWSREIP